MDASKGRDEMEMLKKVAGYLKNEKGIETLEWIAVGALILAVGAVVYPGTLQAQLVTAITSIGTTLNGLATP
jgi:Flp pilus assembly pilin Flp